MTPYFVITNYYPEDAKEIIRRSEALLGENHIESKNDLVKKEINIHIKHSTPMSAFDKVESMIKESFAPHNILVTLEIP